ncbi:MAG TPA: DNA-binding transcriptional regulator, partial [Polyangia bacterium]|nr:DNA-binding transcriptional regulator [Polyangia bacterium]
LESVDPRSCLLLAGVPSLDGLAVWMSTLGVEFEIQDPPEARAHLRKIGERALRAAGVPTRTRRR